VQTTSGNVNTQYFIDEDVLYAFSNYCIRNAILESAKVGRKKTAMPCAIGVSTYHKIYNHWKGVCEAAYDNNIPIDILIGSAYSPLAALNNLASSSSRQVANTVRLYPAMVRSLKNISIAGDYYQSKSSSLSKAWLESLSKLSRVAGHYEGGQEAYRKIVLDQNDYDPVLLCLFMRNLGMIPTDPIIHRACTHYFLNVTIYDKLVPASEIGKMKQEAGYLMFKIRCNKRVNKCELATEWQ
jgi:hypothetical protein